MTDPMPTLPPSGSTEWYGWASAVHERVTPLATKMALGAKWSRGESLRRATQLGTDVLGTPPTVTVTAHGISADNYDQAFQMWENPTSALITGLTAGFAVNPSHAAPAGGGPAYFRLFGGAPVIATHNYVTTVGSVIDPALLRVQIGHVGTKLSLGVTPEGGGTYNGAFRIKVDGRYISRTPTLLNSSDGGLQFINLDFTALGYAARTIEFELQNCSVQAIQAAANDGIFLPPHANGIRCYVIGDSFAAGANASDGAGGAYSGLVPQLLSSLGISDGIVDAYGGTGLLKTNGGSNNFLNRIQSYLPALQAAAPIDLAIIVGSVNDIGYTRQQLQDQAAAVYTALAPIPVIHLVMPGGGGAADMATPLAGYRAAATTAGNVLGVIDMTDALTGTGTVGSPTASGTRSLLLSADNTHPAQAGHDYYAARALASVQSELQALTSA